MFSIPKESQLKTPGGTLADKMTRILTLFQWAKEFEKEIEKIGEKIRYVALGHPVSRANLTICSTSVEYWGELREKIRKIEFDLKFLDELALEEKENKVEYTDHFLQKVNLVLYRIIELLSCDDSEIAELAAQGLKKFYGLSSEKCSDGIELKGENILFTQGGQGGLSAIFNVMNRRDPNGYIILQQPYYTLYNRADNNLITYDTILETSDNLNVRSLASVLKEAKREAKNIKMIIFCTPNNPSGKSNSFEEWEAIFEALKDEDCYILVDEAYNQLDFSDKFFLLEFLYAKIISAESNEERAPYLKVLKKVMFAFSGTKGQSVAGERDSLIFGFDEEIMGELDKEVDNMGPAPFAAKLAFAKSINKFISRVLDPEVNFLRQFYEPQVRYVEKRLKEIGIEVKDSNHSFSKVDGTFYVTGDFKSLIGFRVNEPEIQSKLKEIGLNGEELKTDEDIAYYLLFKKYCVLAPVSYFGGDPEEGKLRITCSGGKKLLDDVLDRIDEVLKMQKDPQESYSFAPSAIILSTGTDGLTTNNITINKNLDFESLFSNEKHQTFISPLENFARWMEVYWKNALARSEEVTKIQERHIKDNSNRLKDLMRPYFIQVVNVCLNNLLGLSSSNISASDFDDLLFSKRTELFNLINGIYSYLKNLYYPESNAPNIFDVELRKYLKVHIEDFYKNRGIIRGTMSKNDLRDLISSLVFEKIFYDIMVKGEETPFSEFFHQFYLLQKEVIDNKFDFIEKVAEKHASIDYSHPCGEESSTEVMAEALALWYGGVCISPKNILFASIRFGTVLGKAFETRIMSFENLTNFPKKSMKESNRPIAILLPQIFNSSGKYIGDSKIEQIVDFLQKDLQKNSNHFIIINEIGIERCMEEAITVNKRSLLNVLLKTNPALFKDKIVLVRSSEGTFSLTREKMYVFVVFNEKLMSTLATASSSVYVHAPRSLQYAYARAMNDFVKGILNSDEYKTEYIKYVKRIDKLIKFKKIEKNKKVNFLSKGKEILRSFSDEIHECFGPKTRKKELLGGEQGQNPTVNRKVSFVLEERGAAQNKDTGRAAVIASPDPIGQRKNQMSDLLPRRTKSLQFEDDLPKKHSLLRVQKQEDQSPLSPELAPRTHSYLMLSQFNNYKKEKWTMYSEDPLYREEKTRERKIVTLLNNYKKEKWTMYSEDPLYREEKTRERKIVTLQSD